MPSLMTNKEYNEHLARLRNKDVAERIAEAMIKLQEVGSMLDEIALIADPKHLEYLYKIDNTLQSVWNSSREEFKEECDEYVSSDDFMDQLKKLIGE